MAGEHLTQRLARRAAANPHKQFVLLIDEINRGNLPRIFGELLYLLEYRDRRVALMYPLAPSQSSAEDLVDGDEGYVVLAGDDGGDEGVVADEVHAEAGGAAGDFEADAAEADDAEGFAAEFGALERFFLPLGIMHCRVGAGDGAYPQSDS